MEAFRSIMEAFFQESQLFQSLRSSQPGVPKRYVYELQPQSVLLDIPGEIREEILKYLLVSTEENNIVRIGEGSTVFPAVLRVCRQLYIEGQPSWQKNIFHIDLLGVKRNSLLPPPISAVVANINPITFDDWELAGCRAALRHLHRLSMRHISLDLEIAAVSTHPVLGIAESKNWFDMDDRRLLMFEKARRSRVPILYYEVNLYWAHSRLEDWAKRYADVPPRSAPVLLSTPKDLTWLFKELAKRGLTEVQTLTINLKGFEGWLHHFSRRHRLSRFEKLPLSTLIYAIVRSKPDIDTIVLQGPECKDLQEFVVTSQIHRQAHCCRNRLCRETTGYDPKDNQLLVLWPVVHEVVKEEHWDEGLEEIGINDTDLNWERDSESLWEAWRTIQRYNLRYEVV